MQNKKLLMISLLLVSGSVFADQTVVEGAAAVGQAMDKVEAVKDVVANPGDAAAKAVKEKAADTVQQAIPAVEAPKPVATPATTDSATKEATPATDAATAAPAPAPAATAPSKGKSKSKKVGKKHHKRHH